MDMATSNSYHFELTGWTAAIKTRVGVLLRPRTLAIAWFSIEASPSVDYAAGVLSKAVTRVAASGESPRLSAVSPLLLWERCNALDSSLDSAADGLMLTHYPGAAVDPQRATSMSRSTHRRRPVHLLLVHRSRGAARNNPVATPFPPTNSIPAGFRGESHPPRLSRSSR